MQQNPSTASFNKTLTPIHNILTKSEELNNQQDISSFISQIISLPSFPSLNLNFSSHLIPEFVKFYSTFFSHGSTMEVNVTASTKKKIQNELGPHISHIPTEQSFEFSQSLFEFSSGFDTIERLKKNTTSFQNIENSTTWENEKESYSRNFGDDFNQSSPSVNDEDDMPQSSFKLAPSSPRIPSSPFSTKKQLSGNQLINEMPDIPISLFNSAGDEIIHLLYRDTFKRFVAHISKIDSNEVPGTPQHSPSIASSNPARVRSSSNSTKSLHSNEYSSSGNSTQNDYVGKGLGLTSRSQRSNENFSSSLKSKSNPIISSFRSKPKQQKAHPEHSSTHQVITPSVSNISVKPKSEGPASSPMMQRSATMSNIAYQKSSYSSSSSTSPITVTNAAMNPTSPSMSRSFNAPSNIDKYMPSSAKKLAKKKSMNAMSSGYAPLLPEQPLPYLAHHLSKGKLRENGTVSRDVGGSSGASGGITMMEATDAVARKMNLIP